MKVYMVTYDGYAGYGIDENLLGIFDTKEKAEEIVDKYIKTVTERLNLPENDYNYGGYGKPEISEIEVNECFSIHLSKNCGETELSCTIDGEDCKVNESFCLACYEE